MISGGSRRHVEGTLWDEGLHTAIDRRECRMDKRPAKWLEVDSTYGYTPELLAYD